MLEHEQDHRIHNPEQAYHMGFAEHPYRELAAVALKHGLADLYEENIAKANKEGMMAGQEYVDSLQASLNYFNSTSNRGIKSEVSTNLEPFKSVEIQSNTTFSKEDVIQFAQETNYADVTKSPYDSGPGSQDAVNASVAGSAWKSLVLFYQRAVLDANHYRPLEIEKLPVITNMEKLAGRSAMTKFAVFTLDSVADFISEVETARLSDQRVPLSFLLGRGFGDSRLDLLKKFIEFKQQQLAQAENPEI